jgi:2-polyprenyl-3-methyl-5-hydroxy-6-metoxy-1,4-benzoquinol methylase
MILKDARVLEIGCGWGVFSRWLAQQGASEVLGADFSSVAIRKATEQPALPNLSFEKQNIQAIRHPAESFDLVVSCETIEHVPDPQLAIREMARVLRPGGTLLLTTPNYLSITGLHRLFRSATGRRWDEGGQPIVNFTMHPRTSWWLRRAGLQVRATDGSGYYLPVRGREGGKELVPPEMVRSWLKLLALHVVINSRKT